MSAAFRIDSFDAIPAAISRMQTAGAEHRVPILQALYRGDIAHLEIGRNGSAGVFKKWAAAIQLPGLALLGDDDHALADGPDTWPIARRVLRWARFVLIHGGPGDALHYDYAVALAKRYRRLVMMECSSARIGAWENAASRWCTGAEGLVMRPPPGGVHPALKTGDLHWGLDSAGVARRRAEAAGIAWRELRVTGSRGCQERVPSASGPLHGARPVRLGLGSRVKLRPQVVRETARS